MKIDSNGLVVEILTVDSKELIASAIVRSPGVVGANKAIDISGRQVVLKPLTDLDIYAIENYANRARCIYLSFTNSHKDAIYAKKLVEKYMQKGGTTGSEIRIIAKVESKAGIANPNEILEVVDGILIDRGDLSREISISKIPIACNLILKKCIEVGKPCFIATDVLENMLKNPLPSRAEISDLYSYLARVHQELCLQQR